MSKKKTNPPKNGYQIKKGTVLMVAGYVPELTVRAHVDRIETDGGTTRYHTTVHDGPADMLGPLSFLESQVRITGKRVYVSERGGRT